MADGWQRLGDIAAAIVHRATSKDLRPETLIGSGSLLCGMLDEKHDADDQADATEEAVERPAIENGERGVEGAANKVECDCEAHHAASTFELRPETVGVPATFPVGKCPPSLTSCVSSEGGMVAASGDNCDASQQATARI